MSTLALFFHSELSGWKRWETILLLISCLIIIGLSLYWEDSLLGIISSTTGVAYTVCNGKGKRIAYLFGLVNSVLYAYISFNAQIYGDAALYFFYYFPAMIIGFFLWNKNMSSKNLEVIKRKMTLKYRLITLTSCACGVILFGLFLASIGDAAPFLDSFTTVVSIIALIVALGRYNEQWPLWTAVNAVEVILWIVRLAQGGAAEAGSSLIMWTLFLSIGIIMWIRWSRQLKETPVDRAKNSNYKNAQATM